MLENTEEPKLADTVPGKMKKTKQIPKSPIRDPKHLWNVPKARRKEILKARLSPKEFVAIFGRQFEPQFRNDGYKVTVPQPFEFGDARSSQYRTAFVNEMVVEDNQRFEITRFRAKSVPGHVYQPIYRDMVEHEHQKKEDVQRRSNFLLIQEMKFFC